MLFFPTYFMTLFCLDIYVLVALSYSIYCQIALISYLLHSKLCAQKSLKGCRLSIFSLLDC